MKPCIIVDTGQPFVLEHPFDVRFLSKKTSPTNKACVNMGMEKQKS
jgi:hypothetical protein